MPKKYKKSDKQDNKKDDSEDKRKKAAYAIAGAAGGAAALKTKQVGQLYKKNAAAIIRASDREYRQMKVNDPKSYKQVTKGNKAAALRAAAQGRSYTNTYVSKSGKMTGMTMSEGSGRARPPRTGPGSGAGGQSASARYSRLTGGGGVRSHGR